MMQLRQTRLVLRREVHALLTMPLYFVLTGIFFILTALMYMTLLVEFARGGPDVTVNVTDSVLRPTFHAVHFFLLFQVPLLTMRIFSEDRASGMLDLLQTTPVRDWPLLAGKFLACVAAVVLYILLTQIFPVATAFFGSIEWPVVVASLLALVLAGAAYTAIGVFFSAITESQVVAAVLSYVMIFMLAFGGYLADGLGIVPLQQALRHFAITDHINMILAGDVAPMNVMYFVAVSAIFLFMTARSLESRRWKA